jgi:hypothetical protein
MPGAAARRPPANTATVTSDTASAMTGRQEPSARGAREFAQFTAWMAPLRRLGACRPASSPHHGRCLIRTHVRRPIGPPLRYSLAVSFCSICSNFASDQVELRRFELLTSCMPSVGSTSAHVHPRRSPSPHVPARPPLSACVAVLSCCTAAIPLGATSRTPDETLTSANTAYQVTFAPSGVHPVKEPRSRPLPLPRDLSTAPTPRQ